ncbi:hypothetical protein [Marinobacterium sediminicola]|uniref:Uncharacterized protein n=1 Tax=Marinobacterium sediminicola TaxID=518898 RepID=A0ABY1S383_9GAMM|nr:hypothetical protein [Marinobacterium sediminicola]ULG68830.1 hypothetical protein LN244_14200 [Marinobacterium sediminicola]SMR77565.1 hypothetical protein SAMN04487964_11456 [Marinobacterium sediminicola]
MPVLELPDIEDILASTVESGARNRRLLIKDKYQRQRRKEYAQHIHGIASRLAGVMQGLLISIDQVTLC